MAKSVYDRVREALNKNYFTTLAVIAHQIDASTTATATALNELDDCGLVVKEYVKCRKGTGRAAVAYRKASK